MPGANFSTPIPITTEVAGRTVHGTYYVAGGVVYVNSEGIQKGTPAGNSDAEDVAKRVLFQMHASFRSPA